MKWLKVAWQWLRLEAMISAVECQEFYVFRPDGSIQFTLFAVDADGERTILDQRVYTRENCPVAIVKTPDGWQAIRK
jgi:hypothetical protein